jgi:hypothetical protein
VVAEIVATTRGAIWSREEVEATVADYFEMLELELAGQAFNKRAHNRVLGKLLFSRSAAAIELKHQNISAILLELGCGYISGYKPRGNYQSLLYDTVADRIVSDRRFDQLALQAAEREAVKPDLHRLQGVLVDVPRITEVRESRQMQQHGRRAVRRDYLEREGRNRSLGLAGE